MYKINTILTFFQRIGEVSALFSNDAYLYHIFASMEKWVKPFLIGAAAFVAYRFFSLWQMVNSLNWSFQSIRFSRPKLRSLADSYVLNIGFKIYNPTSTTIYINRVSGYVEYDGYILGRYNLKGFKVNAGDTKLNVELDLDPKYVATILIPDLTTRKAPRFTLITNATFFMGLEITNRFTFNVKDYLPEGVSQIFFK